MADLIDREKLLKALGKICDQYCPGLPASMRDLLCGYCLLANIMTVVEKFPHEEPKRGRWEIVIDRDGSQMEDEWFGSIFRCNICGHRELEDNDIRFCAGCGAKMEGFGRDDKGAGGDEGSHDI